MSTSAVIASGQGHDLRVRIPAARLVVARDRLVEKHAAAVERVEAERRAAAHAALVARRDELAARFESIWRDHAEPLAAYLHEVAAVDEEIATANRLRLGPWLDRTETIARPGVSDLDQHKLVSMATRLPPWDHDAHRSRRAAMAAAAAAARPQRDGAGGAAAARGGHCRRGEGGHEGRVPA